MAAKRIGEIVLPIPFPGGARYVKVGSLLQHEKNDPAKGPGFSVVLDRHFNPAGAPMTEYGDPTSVFLSVYHPKDKEDLARKPPRDVRRPPGTPLDDDDIPF